MQVPNLWGKKLEPKIKKIGNKLTLEKKFSRNETYRINQRKGMFSISFFKQPKITSGYTSMCADMKHILCLDYDRICKWIVLKELNQLIKDFHLSPFFLFKSDEKILEKEVFGNYHAVCLTKLPPAAVINIQKHTHCDRAYRTMPTRNIYRSWVLRTAPKGDRGMPEYIGTVGTRMHLESPISNAHYKLLKKLYNVPDIPYGNPDNLEGLYLNVYETGNV